MGTTIAILGLLAAIASALGALGAWRAALQANSASAAMAAIETQRRHTEMAPVLRLGLESETDTSAILRVAIDGPDHLDRIDAITILIRDDTPNRAELAHIAGGPTAESIREQIWGPLHFQHGTDGGTADGRSVEPFGLDVGENRPLLMRPTAPPPWYGDTSGWRRNYDGAPLRVTVTCVRQGFEPWVFQREVPRMPSVEQTIH